MEFCSCMSWFFWIECGCLHHKKEDNHKAWQTVLHRDSTHPPSEDYIFFLHQLFQEQRSKEIRKMSSVPHPSHRMYWGRNRWSSTVCHNRWVCFPVSDLYVRFGCHEDMKRLILSVGNIYKLNLPEFCIKIRSYFFYLMIWRNNSPFCIYSVKSSKLF